MTAREHCSAWWAGVLSSSSAHDPTNTSMAGTQLNGETLEVSSQSQTPTAITIVAHDIGSVGGMERQLEDLIMGLRRQGHEVTVIARTCELPEGSGVVFHRVRAPGRPFLL